MIMVYNRYSYRRAVMLPVRATRRRVWRDPVRRAELVRGTYDANSAATAAPATEFTSVRRVRTIFSRFSDVHVRRENFDDFVLTAGPCVLSITREAFLNNLAHIGGLDLYVTATK